MRRFKIFAAIAAFAMMAISVTETNAQSKEKGKWQERVMAEKIAFITMEVELTPEEAQAFWPVYNQIDAEKKAAQKKVGETYKALTKALEEGTASEKEISSLLDEYLTAKQAKQERAKGDTDRFRKVLSGTKVAKLYIAEENFRRNHIRNLGGHSNQGPKPQGHNPRPQDGTPGPRK